MEYFIKTEIFQITLAIASLWKLFEIIEKKEIRKLKVKEENIKTALIKHLNNKCKEFRENFQRLLSQHKQWRSIHKNEQLYLAKIKYFTSKIAKIDYIRKDILHFLIDKEKSLVLEFKEKYDIIKILEQQYQEIRDNKDLHRYTGPLQTYYQRRFADEIIYEILQDTIENISIYAINTDLTIKYKNGKTLLSFHVKESQSES